MIWGKTKEKTRPKIGDEKVVYLWFPNTLPDGRWVWLEYVQVKWKYVRQNEAEWVIQGMAKRPIKEPLHKDCLC